MMRRRFDRFPRLDYDPGVREIAERQVKARNTSAHSENKIHDDATARTLGFRGGLVPGVTVYAYLTFPVVSAWGDAWLDRGTASVRFASPIYEGEEVTLRTAEATDGGLEVTALNPAGQPCAVLAARIGKNEPPAWPSTAPHVTALPQEAARPPASREVLERVDVLGCPALVYDEPAAAEYLDSIGDTLAVYRGPHGCVHPAVVLKQANQSLSRNVRLGPWIHVGSEVWHLGGARVGERLVMLGRVHRLFERKGRELVELDLLFTVDGTRPVARVRHTAIYKLSAIS
jgi:acyl dehydratase